MYTIVSSSLTVAPCAVRCAGRRLKTFGSVKIRRPSARVSPVVIDGSKAMGSSSGRASLSLVFRCSVSDIPSFADWLNIDQDPVGQGCTFVGGVTRALSVSSTRSACAIPSVGLPGVAQPAFLMLPNLRPLPQVCANLVRIWERRRNYSDQLHSSNISLHFDIQQCAPLTASRGIYGYRTYGPRSFFLTPYTTFIAADSLSALATFIY